LIHNRLRQAGWHSHNHIDTRGILQWLNVNAPVSELPLLPHVHNNNHETIRMAKETSDPDRLNVIRLWPAAFQPPGKNSQLWVGSVTQVERRQLVKMITYPATTRRFDIALQVLANSLNPVTIKTVTRTGMATNGISSWSGDILLVRP
ncbi:MAG TPA: hypothetical protein ENI64_09795, partial [Gammaproteobacteria bacterium]|nr:hypothetical protein [Gammaproteobacteria bacterium]